MGRYPLFMEFTTNKCKGMETRCLVDITGGECITQNRNETRPYVEIIVYAPAVSYEINLLAGTKVKLDELRRIAAEWVHERTNGRFPVHEDNILLREKTSSCFYGERLIEEMGIEPNEMFYLF